MIRTLFITVLIEGCVVLAYSALQKRPAGNLLRASLVVNVLTQVFLWVVLKIFFRQYLLALIVTEVIIWLVESILMYHLPRGQLRPSEAVWLSLCMNLSSFGVGWLLPL